MSSEEEGLRSYADFFAYLHALLDKPAKNGAYINQFSKDLEGVDEHQRANAICEKLKQIINRYPNATEVPDDVRAQVQAAMHILRKYGVSEQMYIRRLQNHQPQTKSVTASSR